MLRKTLTHSYLHCCVPAKSERDCCRTLNPRGAPRRSDARPRARGHAPALHPHDRAPPLTQAARSLPNPRGAAAELEALSVPAFLELAADLARHGRPGALQTAARRAADEERRHAGSSASAASSRTRAPSTRGRRSISRRWPLTTPSRAACARPGAPCWPRFRPVTPPPRPCARPSTRASTPTPMTSRRRSARRGRRRRRRAAFLVVGRLILDVPDPVAAADAIGADRRRGAQAN